MSIDNVRKSIIRTENVTSRKIVRSRVLSLNGSAPRAYWMVEINDMTLGEVEVARWQADPMFFRSRSAAAEAAEKVVRVHVLPNIGDGGNYAVAA